MTQQIIDTGLVANDGTGESLRNAFTSVNNNFANVWSAGPVDTQVVIYSNVVSTNVTNLDLRLAGNGVGTITVESTMVPSIDRVYDLGSPSKKYDSVYAQYYFGNGAFLTGISGGNAVASNSFSTISANGVNIVATSATDTLTLSPGNNIVILGNSGTDTISVGLVNNPAFSGNITAGGNIIGSNVNTVNLSLSGNVVSGLTVAGNVVAPYFLGNGSQLSGVLTSISGNLSGNVNTGVYNLYSNNGAVKVDDTLSVTGTVITSGGILSGGPIATAANVTAGYFIGDGSQLTNLPPGNYSNANVAAYLPTYTGNISAGNISTTGNISGAYVLGNGSQLTGVLTSLVGPLSGNIDTLEYSINSSNGEVRFGNTISVVGSAIITNDLLVGDQIATTANVTASYFIGDGSQLTNLPAGNYSNANVAAYLPTYSGNISAGNISTTGNIRGQYVLGNGSQLTGITASLSGNLTGNINTGIYNLYSSNGAVTVNDGLSVTGSITAVGGLITPGSIATTANITANYFIGDGSQLTNLPAGNYSNANVAAYLPTYTGNVAANNFIGNGATLTNITGANVVGVVTNATNAVNSAQANYANIANSVTGSNVVGIVANAAYAVTASSANTANTSGLAQYVTANAQANITSLGVLTSLSSTGNVTGNYIIGNGSQLTGVIKSLTGSLAGNIDTLEYSINSSNGEVRFGNSISVVGNATVTDNLLVGDQIATTGNITTAANVIAQYFVGNFIGNISGNLVVPGANTDVVFNTNGAADATSGLRFNKTSNTLAIGGNVSAIGNISGNYILGNGSQLTGLPALYGNANVADYLNVYTGNISAGNVSAIGNISGNYILGNGSQLTGLPALYGNANVADYLAVYTGNISAGNVSVTGNVSSGNVSVTGNVSSGNISTAGNVSANILVGNTASVTGNITTSGNVTASYFVGNFTGNISGNLTAPGANTEVIFNTDGSADASAGFTFNKVSNALAVTGNISGNYILGNGSQLTGIDATSIQNGNSNVRVAANGNVSVGVAGTSDVVVISANGQYITGIVSASGNIIANNVNTSNISPVSGALTISTATGNLNLQPAGNIVLANTYINSVAYPTQDTDAATKLYVDTMVSTGLAYHAPVDVATTTTLASATGGTITYSQPNGAANGVGALLTTTGSFNLIDTSNVQTVGTRILVKNEANSAWNGVYTWANVTNIVRSTDADTYGSDSTADLSLNDYFFVQSGNVNKGSAYVVSAPAGTITFGTSNIVFSQFSSAPTYTANTEAGIALVGTQLNAKVDQNTTAFDVSGNIVVKPGANLTTPNIGAATGTSLSLTGNVAANYVLGNISQASGLFGNNVNMGSNTQGALISNAVTLTTSTTVTNGIALLNQVLGKLVPPAPPNFPNAITLSLSGTASYRMANITQVDNTPGANRAVAAGTTVANVLRAATYATNTISTVGPGDAGIITAVRNGANVGNVTLNTGASPSANGTYGGNLVISNNYDYHTANANITAGFWYVFSAAVSGSAAPGGWNELYIADSSTGNTNTTVWYYDNSSPSTPSFSSTTMTPPGSANLLYSSTIPHYTNNNNFNISFNVANISGNTYPTSNTLASGSSGGAFAAPASINYSASNIGSNILGSFASASANTTASIVTGFGSSSTGPSMSVNNSYSTGTLTLTTALGNTVLWKSGTSTAIDESNVVINTTIGTGSGNAYRIVNPGTGNTPAYTGSEAAFNSQSSTLQTYDATVVGSGSSGVLKHDQTNYSTGYLPVGPNLSSGRSGTQYFTIKFVRTAVSKFDIKYTGNIAGMWVALPGSVIDSSSGANGWINMAASYGGAGYPGVNSPGNGTDGCALGGTVSLNTSVTNSSKTCTFGTVSSSSTATNEIYVRIALTSGQSVTALTLETASN